MKTVAKVEKLNGLEVNDLFCFGDFTREVDGELHRVTSVNDEKIFFTVHDRTGHKTRKTEPLERSFGWTLRGSETAPETVKLILRHAGYKYEEVVA
jgi:hypothetical protein